METFGTSEIGMVLGAVYLAVAVSFLAVLEIRYWQTLAARRWARAAIAYYREMQADPSETVRDLWDMELCVRDILLHCDEILEMERAKPLALKFLFWPSEFAVSVGLEWRAMEMSGLGKKKIRERLRREKSRA